MDKLAAHKYMTLKPSPIDLSFHGLQRFAMGMGTMMSCFALGFFIGSDIYVLYSIRSTSLSIQNKSNKSNQSMTFLETLQGFQRHSETHFLWDTV